MEIQLLDKVPGSLNRSDFDFTAPIIGETFNYYPYRIILTDSSFADASLLFSLLFLFFFSFDGAEPVLPLTVLSFKLFV